MVASPDSRKIVLVIENRIDPFLFCASSNRVLSSLKGTFFKKYYFHAFILKYHVMNKIELDLVSREMFVNVC